MPIQYSSIRAEHMRVRTTVGVFDVSHMGEFIVKGQQGEAFVDRVTVNDVRKLAVGQVQYSCMCLDNGGIVDDLLIYRFPDKIMLVVNGANIDKDWKWLVQHKPEDVEMTNQTDEIALLAVQGRDSEKLVQSLTETNLQDIKYYWFVEGKVAGAQAVISRTGYTGEDGFELYLSNDDAVPVWNALFENGKAYDIEPIGLGARDSLRLEMKMCLYGNDIDETTNPLEAGLGWITKLKKGNFIGRDALLEIKARGLKRKLSAIELTESGFPRHGYPILNPDGIEPIGVVTSGTSSPVLNKGIAMGYVPLEQSVVGSDLSIDCRGKMLHAKVVKPPFYQRPY